MPIQITRQIFLLWRGLDQHLESNSDRFAIPGVITNCILGIESCGWSSCSTPRQTGQLNTVIQECDAGSITHYYINIHIYYTHLLVTYGIIFPIGTIFLWSIFRDEASRPYLLVIYSWRVFHSDGLLERHSHHVRHYCSHLSGYV